MAGENVVTKYESSARCVLRSLRGHVLNRALALHFRRTEMGGPSVRVTPGDQYGRLTVVKELPIRITPYGNRRVAECRCRCGAMKAILLDHLRRGSIVSCGCHRRENSKQLKTTHGLHSDIAYNCWHGMIRRCTASDDANYQWYGGRGISVCERWMSFAAFLEDMGPRPSLQHTIDRFPNQNGNYEPVNCRWATRPEQHRNTRHNRMISHDGKTLCITDWAQITGLSRTQIGFRLNRGWPVEFALTLPNYSRIESVTRPD